MSTKKSAGPEEIHWIKNNILNVKYKNKSDWHVSKKLDTLKILSDQRHYHVANQTIEFLEIYYRDSFAIGMDKLVSFESIVKDGHPVITEALFNYYAAQFFFKHKLEKESRKRLKKAIDYALENCEIDVWLDSEMYLLNQSKSVVSKKEFINSAKEKYKLFKLYNKKGKAISLLTNLIYFTYVENDTNLLKKYQKDLDEMLIDYNDLDTLFRPLYYMHQEQFALRGDYSKSDSIIDLGLKVPYYQENPIYSIFLLVEKASNCLDQIKKIKKGGSKRVDQIEILGDKGLAIIKDVNSIINENANEIRKENYHYLKVFTNYLRGHLHKELGNKEEAIYFFNRNLILFAESREYNISLKEFFEKQSIDNLKEIVDGDNEFHKFGQYYLSFLASKKRTRELYEKNMYEYFNIIETKSLRENLDNTRNLITLQRVLVALLFVFILLAILLLRNNSRDIKKMHSKNLQLIQLNKELIQVNSSMKENMVQLKKAKESANLFMRLSAHDLITPVRNIVLMLALVRRKMDINPWKARFDAIFGEAKNMYQLLSNFNTYLEQTNTYEFNEVALSDVNQIVETVINELKIDHSIRIEKENLSTICFDKNALQKVMYNLIHNSIRFRSSYRPLVIKIKQYMHGQDMVLEVTDNGQGIERRFLKSIFRLFDEKPEIKGQGSKIGLSVCKEVVENQGASIEVASQYGLSTSFYIRTRTSYMGNSDAELLENANFEGKVSA